MRKSARKVRTLAQEVQHLSGESVTLAFVDQGYTGQEPVRAAWQQGMQVHIITRKEAKKAWFCCLAVGLSSRVLAGTSVFDDWQEIM